MKSIHYILLLTMTLGLFGSCKKEEQRAIAKTGTATTFSASTSSIELSKETADEDVISFQWTESDFGFQAEIENVIQFDVTGGDFSTAAEVTPEAASASKSLKGAELNSILLAMGLPVGEPVQLIVRLKSQVKSSTLAPVYSATISLNATPFSLISYVYVPGDYQGWNPATADSLASQKSNGIYDGIIYFADNPGASFEFKIAAAKNWNLAYGGDATGKLSTDGGNLKAPGVGSYRIVADINALTYEMTYYQFGLIGDATVGGWETDTDMIFDNGAQVWRVTTQLNVGNLKFRLNHDWGVNYGGANGIADSGGSDIPISEAGEYVITLDVNSLSYSIVKK